MLGARAIVFAFVVFVCASCGSFDASEGDGARDPDGGATGEAGAADATGTDGATGDARDGGGRDGGAGACPGLCIGFEDGFSGLAVTGSPAIEKTNPLKGLQSMAVKTGSAYVTVDLSSASEVWVSFYLRTGQVMNDATPLAMLAGGSPVVALRASGLSLNVVGAGITGGALSTTFTPGTMYRVALHTKAIGGSVEVEGWLANGDAPFGPRAASGVVTGASAPTSFRIGAADGTTVDAVFDDVVVSTTGLPAPSP